MGGGRDMLAHAINPVLRSLRLEGQEFEVSLNDREVLSPNEQEDHPTKIKKYL